MSTGSKGSLVQCYNKACGKQFDPHENKEDSCLHHPGVPVFHDAYKKWSCCDKKTTDFTEFLNIKGCTRSFHNSEKPEEPPKPKRDVEAAAEVYKYEASKPARPPPVKRPNEDLPLVPLPSTVGASLQPLLEKVASQTQNNAADQGDNSDRITLDTPCKNAGCKQTYQGEESNIGTCIFHPGVPIFHEGMKFWSCCQRKTSDFSNFLEQIGCTSGNHCWVKKAQKGNEIPCRYDWHQTGAHVVVSVYSKVPIPEQSYIEANPVKLHMFITFGENRNVFDLVLILHGVIDVQKSSVQYLGSKVEIKLRKAEPVSWKDLAILTKAGQVNHEEPSSTMDIELF